MKLLDGIRENARGKGKIIVLPESHDERVLKAAEILIKEGICQVILVGEEDTVKKRANELGIDLNKVNFVFPENYERFEEFAETYYEKRKEKGVTNNEAKKIMKNYTFFAAMLVEKGVADGCVSGADTTTGEVLRAALHIIGTAEGVKTVSSDILIITPNEGKVYSFADCAVLPDPDAEQLADIAISTAETHKRVVGEDPIVAMLSFSTKGSAKHKLVDKVIEATKIVKEKRPDILIDGELQFDAAIVEKVGRKKAPGSEVAGRANVLIFPDLNSGNIGYKIAQRIGKCEAVGPIIQGLAKPMNDLSRGCSVDDIVNVAAILCNMA
ncbi:MAG: phosphate acetyltransferase [Candidatus Marinimicrobia bacterium]|nr:phosphate acetyltransferase [Candidatus Neomarinimicrobiota bacterium]